MNSGRLYCPAPLRSFMTSVQPVLCSGIYKPIHLDVCIGVQVGTGIQAPLEALMTSLPDISLILAQYACSHIGHHSRASAAAH